MIFTILVLCILLGKKYVPPSLFFYFSLVMGLFSFIKFLLLSPLFTLAVTAVTGVIITAASLDTITDFLIVPDIPTTFVKILVTLPGFSIYSSIFGVFVVHTPYYFFFGPIFTLEGRVHT